MNSTRTRRYYARSRASRAWQVTSSEGEAELGERRADGRAGEHVGWIVQAENHARGGDERREWQQHPAELGKMGAGLPGEGHRMQRVSRGEAVAIERRCGPADRLVRDERALAYE